MEANRELSKKNIELSNKNDELCEENQRLEKKQQLCQQFLSDRQAKFEQELRIASLLYDKSESSVSREEEQ